MFSRKLYNYSNVLKLYVQDLLKPLLGEVVIRKFVKIGLVQCALWLFIGGVLVQLDVLLLWIK